MDSEGRLMGAMGCAAPAFRCDEKRKVQIREIFMKATEKMEVGNNADK